MNDVLIVEDHAVVAKAARELIVHKHPALAVRICGSADAALRELGDPAREWHRILLDLDVPGAYGLSLALEIHRRGLAPITCVITGWERQDFIAELKGRGFLGYIPKSTAATAFSSALSDVFAGDPVFPDPREGRRRGTDTPAVRITPRQIEVLELVSRGHSSKQIAAKLGLSEGSIDNSVNAAMNVLGAASRSHAVAKAIELGFLRLAPADNMASAGRRAP